MGFLDKLRADQATPASVTDPVCGMTIDPKDAADRREHNGQMIHFCSAGCTRKFDADPAAFAPSVGTL